MNHLQSQCFTKDLTKCSLVGDQLDEISHKKVVGENMTQQMKW